MRIEVTGRHMEVTPAIEEYAGAKCAKLPRFFNGILQIEVLMESLHHSTETFEVELRVDVVKHDTFVTKVDGPDLYKCMDQCVEKMSRQLTDYKEKLREH